MRTEGQRTHWTGPDVPADHLVGWGDSLHHEGTLYVRLARGWVSEDGYVLDPAATRAAARAAQLLETLNRRSIADGERLWLLEEHARWLALPWWRRRRTPEPELHDTEEGVDA